MCSNPAPFIYRQVTKVSRPKAPEQPLMVWLGRGSFSAILG
jgi:hypothetical protein